jgi:pyruvate/2-oxoglutarate dehydrogenase complex dihydrolipoamide dehydrogenase (E3) component
MKYDYDLLVIGGGAAGLTAAGMAAVLGAKTALVEADKLGGDCTWHGCVPSKTLLRTAKLAHEMRTADRYGLAPYPAAHDFSRVMAHVRAIRETIYAEADAPPHFEKLGVEVIEGRARFVSPHEVAIAGTQRTVSSRRFVVAAGSSPRVPRLDSDGSVPILTNETIFETDRLPGHLVVLGAGPVGVEMAQAFHRLGSAVTVINRSGGILARDDRELAGMLLDQLRAEGIGFCLDTQIERLESGAVRTTDGRRLPADAVLAAAGRTPNLGHLDLARAGVRVSDAGIVVDRRCRSSAPHIFACGDIAGRYLFTHMAEHMAKVAVTNAILHIPMRLDDRHITWTTFTDPELAQVGATEAELQRGGVRYSVVRFPFARLDRAITESATVGSVKVLTTWRGRILGASILGAHAGEMIAEYALAMRNGVTLDKVSSTIHPYPTYALGNRRAADNFVASKLTPGMVRWIRRLFGLRGGLQGVGEIRKGI